jgi:hypothetical protein
VPAKPVSAVPTYVDLPIMFEHYARTRYRKRAYERRFLRFGKHCMRYFWRRMLANPIPKHHLRSWRTGRGEGALVKSSKTRMAVWLEASVRSAGGHPSFICARSDKADHPAAPLPPGARLQGRQLWLAFPRSLKERPQALVFRCKLRHPLQGEAFQSPTGH